MTPRSADEPLLRLLLRHQAPHLADLSLTRAPSGWDNHIWRLGDDLAVRLARRAVAAHLHAHEQAWLPVIASRLPLPVPVPLVIGRSGPHYPWPWSVVPWFEGQVAAVTPPTPVEAQELGSFLAALHHPAPDDAPHNPDRSVPLALRRQAIGPLKQNQSVDGDLSLAEAADRTIDAGVAVGTTRERVWLHGDLHPRNVLVNGGRLAAVLDWGDITAGDPATDLAAVWWLFELPAHDGFWAEYRPVTRATWHRARAWAALFGLSFLTFALPDDPGAPDLRAHELARQLLRRVVAPQRSFGQNS